MRTRKRSFFTELLINFMLLLCVPTITILLILWQSNMIVKKQVLDIESKSMHLYVEQLDDVMRGMKDTCYSVYSSEYCRLYASNSEVKDKWSYDLRTKVFNLLQSLDKTDYYDVFIYYYNDRIISSRYGTVDVEDYYATYYSDMIKDQQLIEPFLDILKTDYKKPKCHVINDGDENSYLCMTMGVRNQKLSELNYTVCVVLNPDYLEQLLVIQKANADSVFQIYNTDMHLVFSNNIKLEENFIADSDFFNNCESEVWLDEKAYMIYLKQSDQLDNDYIYAVSKEVFWSTLRWLRILGYAGAGLCMIISILIAYRSALRAYQPVGNIMELLNRKKGDDAPDKAKSEFSHIISFMESQERTIKENKNIKREWFLHGLLEGKEKNITPQILEKNNVSFVGESFVVCIIHADILKSKMDGLCAFTVQNVMEEVCDFVGKGYFLEISSDRYVLLVNLFTEDIDLRGVLQYAQEFLCEKIGIVLSIGYSDGYKGVSGIPEAYKEAQETIRYRFLMGNGRLIAYNEIKERSSNYRNDKKSKVYMLLSEYIESKKVQMDLNTFVEQLMHIYQINEEMSMDVALLFKNEIISALCKIMEKCDYTEEEICSTKKKMKNSATLLDFQQQLSCNISDLCKRNIKRNRNQDVLTKLVELIDESYKDGELSIAMLGAQIGMQPAQISKIFKEKYGIPLLDYIANVRIFHAKHMLSETDWPIQSIGEKAGFLSSQVFIRTFKKKEGITPGKYREMTRNDLKT